MIRLIVSLWLCLMILGAAAQAEIIDKPVEYSANGTTLKGYLAYDDSIEGKRPGILVVHEWWGLNDYARERARMLAELGYTALAVDMYGEGKQAEHPKEAGQFAGEVRQKPELAKRRFMAGLELLRGHETTDPERIAAIGYCFGGGVVLQMARAGVDLDGVVSFHGSLSTQEPAKPGEVEAKVRVFHGGDDQFVTSEQVAEFEQEMQQAGVDYEVVVYPGAKHGFTNPSADELAEKFDLPLAYDPQADKDSWAKMQAFFQKIFEE